MKSVSLTKIALISTAVIAQIALAGRPSMAAVTTNITVPLSETFSNPCNGDPMAFVGLIHLLATTTFDAAGVHTEFHFDQQQGKDTDLLTGVVCTDIANLNEGGLNVVDCADKPCTPTGDLPLAVTAVLNFTVSCPGSAGSFVQKALAHATVNPDGTVTVNFSSTFPGR